MGVFRKSGVYLALYTLFLLAIVAHSIYRDVLLANQKTGDLRNRVVGARLQKDGKDPYFYQWKKEDGYRYFDPQNASPYKVSNITASPAFHDLLIPIADLSQRTISTTWFLLQYAMLAIMTLLFTRLCKTRSQRLLIISFAALFLFTEAWKHLMYLSQLYFFIAFLITLVFYGLLNQQKKEYLLLAAISTAILILVRPTALIILLPFALQYKSFYKYLSLSAAFIFIYAIFALVNDNERNYWISYNKGIAEQVKVHQKNNPALKQDTTRLPVLEKLEGFTFEELNRDNKVRPYIIKTENGNFFVLVRKAFHKNMSTSGLAFFFLATSLALLVGFWFKKSTASVPISQTMLLAFLLYILSDIFSPIHRHQYYTVQWLPLLLLAMLSLKNWLQPASILIVLGLLLNILRTSLVPAPHTIGEFCWLLALLFILFKKDTHHTEWNMQSS